MATKPPGPNPEIAIKSAISVNTGTIKWTIGNKVACEFLGSRNFALEGKAGVYKNADLVVNYHL